MATLLCDYPSTIAEQACLIQGAFCRIRENPGLVSTEGWKKVRASQYFSTEEPGESMPDCYA